MSNEYKDWERDLIEDQNRIVEKYPFLRARKYNGTIDYEDKFPMMELEIPDGWFELFFQMCDDIKPILEKKGLIDEFYFVQVKEKFNQLRCYAHQDIPEIENILTKYEFMARSICTICGAPAEYETYNYIASFCKDCLEKHIKTDSYNKIEFKDSITAVVFDKQFGGRDETISLKDEWNRYLNRIKGKKI